MKDWRGTELTEGSTIIYTVTSSHTPHLREAVVEKIAEETINSWSDQKQTVLYVWVTKERSYSRTTDVGRKTKLTQVGRVTVIA